MNVLRVCSRPGLFLFISFTNGQFRVLGFFRISESFRSQERPFLTPNVALVCYFLCVIRFLIPEHCFALNSCELRARTCEPRYQCTSAPYIGATYIVQHSSLTAIRAEKRAEWALVLYSLHILSQLLFFEQLIVQKIRDFNSTSPTRFVSYFLIYDSISTSTTFQRHVPAIPILR